MPSVRTQNVGRPVENGRLRVDDPRRSPAVHRTDAVVHCATRLSSTALTAPDASVHRDCATFSPASTDAKTMDENLYSLMDNDKSDHQARVGDNRPVERSDA
jgi:hypothetical protein